MSVRYIIDVQIKFEKSIKNESECKTNYKLNKPAQFKAEIKS